MRIPDRFANATIKSLGKKDWELQVIDYAAHLDGNMAMGMGLLLSGPPGTGKTWAMAALTHRYVQAVGRENYVFDAAALLVDLLDDIEPRWDDYRDQSYWRTLTHVPWLVINDLGKEYRGGKLGEQVPYRIGRLLRERSERLLVTHITTNLSGPDIKKTYGDSIASLLDEMMKTVGVLGEDRRKKRTSG